jgi:glycosyltransferase involved in cell wall biosynthesis
MNIVQLTPGAGKMFCGGCLRDNALVSGLRQLGHQTVMAPLYLPLTLDEKDETLGMPVFFGGINVFLGQKFPRFRHAPQWLRNVLSAPSLLALASGKAAKTRPADVGDLTLSMLRGGLGRQSRDLDELIAWLKDHEKPEIISLSNVLLAGMARRIKEELRLPVVCSLQGEDWFLDSLGAEHREEAWRLLAGAAENIDLFIAPSRYYAALMSQRMRVPAAKMRVVYNGVHLAGYEVAPRPPEPPVLGFFARMCREKGLDLLAEAFVLVRKRGGIPNLQLKVGGSCGPADLPVVASVRKTLSKAGLLSDASFHPNLSLAEKHAFYRSLSMFSTPAPYGEAFGLYLIEAMAAGVPVVQPDHGAFPELIAASGAGLTFPAGKPKDLADALQRLCELPDHGRALGLAGRKSAETLFTVEAMARSALAVFQEALGRRPAPAPLAKSRS